MAEPLTDTGRAWIFARARRDPGAPALRCGETDLSFGALAARAGALAARLAALGIRRGDRLALLMEASSRWVELLHAAQWLGATLVPLNTRLTAAEIGGLLAAVEPALLVHDAALADRVPRTGARRIEAAGEIDAAPAAPVPAPAALDGGEIHTILHTSGTTGRPKGAMLTHGNHLASAAASRANLGVRPGDRWLVCLPLHHVGGLSVLLRSVIDGVPVTLQRGFDAAAVDRAIAEEGITLTSLVATTLTRLLDHHGAGPFSAALRAVLLGGGPVPPALVERAAAAGLQALPTYGLTETASQVATAAPGEALARPASAGRPLGATALRIDAPDVEGRGEILVRGPIVMAGYFRDPVASAAVLRDGWLHTGDVGQVDSRGFLTVDDRRGDLIITGGENVYPAEVEAVLLDHPDVAEAAVFAEPDAEWGQRVAAAVVPRPGAALDPERLRGFCASRLARFKVPRAITFRTALPRTASGKVRRRALRDDGA